MNRLCLLAAALLASATLNAQLPVDREPHHKVIQENHYYRLLEGNIPMNDTTPAHIHAANSVIIFLSHSTFGIQVVGDRPVITTVNPGDFKYTPYGDKPVNHIVWNQTPALFHFYVVELRKGVQATSQSLTLTAAHPLHLTSSSLGRLIIAISGTINAGPAATAATTTAVTATTTLSPYQYRFFPPNTPIDLKGTGRCITLGFY